jgi:hypothetical protein
MKTGKVFMWQPHAFPVNTKLKYPNMLYNFFLLSLRVHYSLIMTSCLKLPNVMLAENSMAGFLKLRDTSTP